MERTPTPLTLVTGASGGIGLELARVCAQHGHNAILVARSRERLDVIAKNLEVTYNIKATVIVQDLAEHDAAAKLVKQLEKAKLQPSILINNAGFGASGRFAENNSAKLTSMIQVNITALTDLTRLLLPGMLERKFGRIMNVASIAGFVPGPGMAVYHATKAYVLSLSEALHEETRDSGVSVTVLCPGPTKSNFAVAAEISEADLFDEGRVMDAATVAKQGYEGMMSGKAVVVTGKFNKLITEAPRLLPRELLARMIGRGLSSREETEQ